MTRPAALWSFDRAALGLLIVFALGLVALSVRSAILDGTGSDILLDLLVIVWLSLPIAAAAALVSASSSPSGALLFLMVEFLLVVSVVLFLLPGLGWGAALALMLLPILHAGAILLAFVIALAFGWRMRPDFLKG